MLVKDIMSSSIIFVSPSDKIEYVAEILAKKKIHGVPVIKNDKLLGIITETDFFVKDSQLYLPSYISFLKKSSFEHSFSEKQSEKIKKLTDSEAKDIMSSPCITVSSKKTVDEAIKIIKKKQIATLPVVNKNKKVVGIITVSDIIGLLKR